MCLDAKSYYLEILEDVPPVPELAGVLVVVLSLLHRLNRGHELFSKFVVKLPILHCKKVSDFLVPARLSLTKLSLAGNIILFQVEFGDGKIANLFFTM